MTGKRHTHQYSKGMIGLPTIMVAACWISLWFLWPSVDSLSSPINHLPLTRISYVPFNPQNGHAESVVPFDISPIITDVDVDKPSEALVNFWTIRDQLLERKLEPDQTSWPQSTGEPATLAKSPDYHPRYEPDPLFKKNGKGDHRVLIELSGNLKELGFKAPEMPTDKLPNPDKSWQVSVNVHVGANGQPDHVFLESGCGDPQIDKMVVMALYGGRLIKPGSARCKGLVTVSYGKD